MLAIKAGGREPILTFGCSLPDLEIPWELNNCSQQPAMAYQSHAKYYTVTLAVISDLPWATRYALGRKQAETDHISYINQESLQR